MRESTMLVLVHKDWLDCNVFVFTIQKVVGVFRLCFVGAHGNVHKLITLLLDTDCSLLVQYGSHDQPAALFFEGGIILVAAFFNTT